MTIHLTDEEEGRAYGLAHDAAWSTVMLRPEEGWRNSYNDHAAPALAAAHTAAHTAMDVFADRPMAEGYVAEDQRAYLAALNALRAWAAAGRPALVRYEVFIPLDSSGIARSKQDA